MAVQTYLKKLKLFISKTNTQLINKKHLPN